VAGQVHGIVARAAAGPMHGFVVPHPAFSVSRYASRPSTPQSARIVFTGSMLWQFSAHPNCGGGYDARMPRAPGPANGPRVRAATWRKTLRPGDLDNEIAAKRAEDRIAAEVPPRAEASVRAMLRGLRRRRLGG